MVKSKWLQTNASQDSRFSPEDDYNISAEERLWKSVVLRAIYDARLIFEAVRHAISVHGSYSIQSLYQYQTMRHELNHEWFDQVCAMAKVSSSTVFRVLDDEAKACGMFSVEPLKIPRIKSDKSEGMH